ncbi:SCO family protein [Gemmatimonas sp.]
MRLDRVRGRRWRTAIRASVLLAAISACTAKPTVRDFTLTDHTGQPFSLESQRGKVVMLFFGYTMCPDVCPTTLSKLTTVTARLGTDRAQVKTVYVTVDPERDSPAVLKADLDLFDLDAVGLTGTREAIDKVVAMYGATYEITPTPGSAAKYSVAHSTTLYIIDPAGVVRREFPYETTADEIVAAIKPLLASPR